MGSISDFNGMLPFLDEEDIKIARKINENIIKNLKIYYPGIGYKGILYGSFIKTEEGIFVIEYNCRFGDPECINLLSILKTDFIDICLGIINENLNEINLEFENKATVCKYLVPKNYPSKWIRRNYNIRN